MYINHLDLILIFIGGDDTSSDITSSHNETKYEQKAGLKYVTLYSRLDFSNSFELKPQDVQNWLVTQCLMTKSPLAVCEARTSRSPWCEVITASQSVNKDLKVGLSISRLKRIVTTYSTYIYDFISIKCIVCDRNMYLNGNFIRKKS